MKSYQGVPQNTIVTEHHSIKSFIEKDKKSSVDNNIDWKTVESFGDEWAIFSSFEEKEIKRIGDQYFDIIDDRIIDENSYVLDVGCGTGRWTRYISDKVGFVEAIDPSSAVVQASHMLKDKKNVRITQAEVDHIPFEDGSFDLVFSLGVLHHIPDTKAGIKKCVEKVKPGGRFMVYLYYNLDNRSVFFKGIFYFSNIIRFVVSSLPKTIKRAFSDLLAILLYLPFISLAKFLNKFSLTRGIVKFIPLSYYRDKSFTVIRNDSLDRFGTPIEHRFSKKQIELMLKEAGLTDIRFSDNEPYWHAVGKKK
ncbi:MAG: class I SAM-dependent methyltransferase [Cytophagaceae bacterium]